MRRYLDTKSLKRSAHWRNQKIHHHIKEFNKSGNLVEEATEELVAELGERFPELDIKLIAGGGIMVKSKGDSWAIENEGKFVVIYHRGWGRKLGKSVDDWHVQGVFQDYHFACAMILSHDNYKITGRGFGFKKIYDLAYDTAMSETRQPSL